MRNLIRIILRYHYVFIFLILELISLSMVVSYNNYQRARFLTSSNFLTGSIYERFSTATQFFDLKAANSELIQENVRLRTTLQHYIHRNNMAVGNLEVPLDMTPIDTLKGDSLRKMVYAFTTARVINNSVNQRHNFITINKGRKHGVRPDMGVISAGKIVGLITNVSDNYSTAISMLNDRWKISAKIKSNDFFGSLSWDGKDYRKVQLNEIPYHVPVQNGDTIITTGFSSSFPEGLMIGTISDFSIGSGSNFYKIEVTLAADFKSLVEVSLVENKHRQEIIQLESQNSNDN